MKCCIEPFAPSRFKCVAEKTEINSINCCKLNLFWIQKKNNWLISHFHIWPVFTSNRLPGFRHPDGPGWLPAGLGILVVVLPLPARTHGALIPKPTLIPVDQRRTKAHTPKWMSNVGLCQRLAPKKWAVFCFFLWLSLFPENLLRSVTATLLARKSCALTCPWGKLQHIHQSHRVRRGAGSFSWTWHTWFFQVFFFHEVSCETRT